MPKKNFFEKKTPKKKTFFLCQKKKFVPKKKQKKIFNSKVATHILCPSFVCKLSQECEDMLKKALAYTAKCLV